MNYAEALATFGGITPAAWTNSTHEAQCAAIEAAWAVNASRRLDLATTIRYAMSSGDKEWREWVAAQEALLPKPPPKPPKTETERRFAQDPNAIYRVIGRGK